MAKWTKVHLGSIADTNVRWSFSGGPFGSNLKASDYTEDGVRIIQLQNIGEGIFNDAYKIFTSEAKADELIANNIYPGEIIFSKMGDPVARACIVPCTAPRYVMASDGIRFKPDAKKADVYFLLNYVNCEAFRKAAESVSSGSTRMRIGLDELRMLEIPLPPLAEQRRIAEILRTWDDAIETAQAELKVKQERKRWLAETVLSGSVRVKGHKTAWDKKRLDQIGKIVPGGTPSTSIPEYWNGDVPWVTPTEITKMKTPYIHITEALITSEGVRNSSAALLPVDSLIVCTRATVGVCAINKVPMTTNQGFKSIVPESTDDTLFLYYVLNSMQSTFNRLAQGSTFLEISKTQFEKMTIIWPEAEERRQIASLMRTADEQTEKIAERIESLRTQKRGLMQKLLTGEVRVAA
jgi:type I restriction enzyme S subunit